MNSNDAAKVGFTVREWYWEAHPYVAALIEGEPETVAQIERWLDWQEKAHGRAAMFRQDGTRVYDAFALGWALERKHLDDNMRVPDEAASLEGLSTQRRMCPHVA